MGSLPEPGESAQSAAAERPRAESSRRRAAELKLIALVPQEAPDNSNQLDQGNDQLHHKLDELKDIPQWLSLGLGLGLRRLGGLVALLQRSHKAEASTAPSKMPRIGRLREHYPSEPRQNDRFGRGERREGRRRHECCTGCP